MKDPVRRKHVVETPEERVRQAVIRMLTGQHGIPTSLMAVEKAIQVQGEIRRPDIVIYDRSGNPWMVIECKAPGISISQATMDQAANYNRVLSAPFLFVTNGSDHFCARVDSGTIHYLEDLPSWSVA